MGHSERACKNGASLAVLALAVAEEERVGSRIAMAETARLSHEAARESSSIVDCRAA